MTFLTPFFGPPFSGSSSGLASFFEISNNVNAGEKRTSLVYETSGSMICRLEMDYCRVVIMPYLDMLVNHLECDVADFGGKNDVLSSDNSYLWDTIVYISRS